MPRRSRSRSPPRRRTDSENDKAHRAREAGRESQPEKMEVDVKQSRRRKFEENPQPQKPSPNRPSERASDKPSHGHSDRPSEGHGERDRGRREKGAPKGTSEDRRSSRWGEREDGTEVGEEGGRTDRFRNEREDRPPHSTDWSRRGGRGSEGNYERGSDWDRQWRERRRGRGRGGGWHGEGRWRGQSRGGGWQGEGQEREEEEGAEGEDNSRLLSSLIDPQEVPRKGFFYEHDDRDAPTVDGRRYTSQRNSGDTKSSSDRAPSWRGRDREGWRGESRRESSDDWRGDRRDRRDREDRGDRRDREDRGDRRDRGDREDRWDRGERGDRRDRGEWRGGRSERGERRGEGRGDNGEWRGDRWSWRGERRRGASTYDSRREGYGGRERQARSPARWRHDLFEEDAGTDTTTTTEAAKENREQKSDGGVDGMWGHDKYEELLKMEDKELLEMEPEDKDLLKMEA